MACGVSDWAFFFTQASNSDRSACFLRNPLPPAHRVRAAAQVIASEASTDAGISEASFPPLPEKTFCQSRGRWTTPSGPGYRTDHWDVSIAHSDILDLQGFWDQPGRSRPGRGIQNQHRDLRIKNRFSSDLENQPRRARTGSIRVARQAGKKHAAPATMVMITKADPNASGSRGLTW